VPFVRFRAPALLHPSSALPLRRFVYFFPRSFTFRFSCPGLPLSRIETSLSFIPNRRLDFEPKVVKKNISVDSVRLFPGTDHISVGSKDY
jgi:hypothetical protein